MTSNGGSTTSGQPSSGGNGNRRGGRNGRGGRGRRNNNGGSGGTRGQGKAKFKGDTSAMNGHVFQVFAECDDKRQFAKTIEALGAYIAKELKYPDDLVTLTRDLENPTIEEPTEPPEDETSRVRIAMFEKECQLCVTRQHELNGNLRAIFAVIWGQCSEAMKAKLQGLDEFKERERRNDCAWLLKEIKGIRHRFEEKRYYPLSLRDALANFYSYRQGPGESLSDYLQHFRYNVDVLEHYGGQVGADPGLLTMVEEEDDELTGELEFARAAKDRLLAIQFLHNADGKRFGGLLVDLENQHSRNTDQYPRDLASAYSLLVSYRPPKVPTPSQPASENASSSSGASSGAPATSDGLQFVQNGLPVPGTDGILHENVKCYRCKGFGHYANGCPVSPDELQLLQSTTSSGFSFAQAAVSLPKSWVLLDSQSTVSVFCNRSLLMNIRPSANAMTVHTNGGSQTSHLVGDVPNFGTVWFNPDSIANILSLAAVRRVCRVTMDSAGDASFLVHRTDKPPLVFHEVNSGLYVHDTAAPSAVPLTFVSTVSANAASFSPREVEGAQQARRLYRLLGRPSQRDFESALKNNLIRNSPVTSDDAKRALIIYGPDVAALKGKTTKRKSTHVPSITPTPVSPSIKDAHGQLTLCADVLFVQGLPFLHTIARHIKFRTITAMNTSGNPSASHIMNDLQGILQMYRTRGFVVSNLHADLQFEPLRNRLLPIHLNVAAQDDHVGDVERSVRTIKERVRSTVHGLPYRWYPVIMVKELVIHAIKSLNQLPSAFGGISPTESPRKIVTGLPDPDYSKMKIEFGQYAQVFEDNTPSNTNAARTTGAIALNPTGNEQGSYYFMSLTTGRKLARNQWTPLPITSDVIERVHQMAQAQRQKEITGGNLLFEWGPNDEVPDDDADAEDTDDGDIGTQQEDAPADEAVVHEPPAPPNDVQQQDENVHDDHQPPEQNDQDALVAEVAEVSESEEGASDNADETMEIVLEEEADNNSEPLFPQENVDTQEEGAQESGAQEDSATQENNAGVYNLRADRERSYEHRYDHQYLHFALAQVAARFLPEATMKEINKNYAWDLATSKYIQPNRPSIANATQKIQREVMLTQMSAAAGIKRYGQPAIDALLKEFLQLDEQAVFDPKHAHELTREQKREALRSVNLIKEKRCGKIKGRSCADGRPQRDKYDKGSIASPALSSDGLMFTLMIDAIERRDVATADIAGAYLKALMPDFVLMKLEGPVVDVFCKMNEDYKQYVTFENGKKVIYVRLNKALYGCVRSALLWYEMLLGALKEMGFEVNPYEQCVANAMINGTQATIAWYVDDLKISHVQSEVVTDIIKELERRFEKMTVTRGNEHTYLGMNIAFKGDGTVELKMEQYIDEAIAAFDEPITNTAPTPAKKDLFDVNHTNLVTWVDASYAIHSDMKSHTGGVMSLGRGALVTKSRKQKLNTKSSTEAEVVGASDYLPNTIWAKRFLAEQGYEVKSTFAQDNQSAIRLEKNGLRSAGKQSWHIDIRFFFIKDRVEQENIEIFYCPTEQMLADFYTKPLQGALFRKFRDVLLGHKHINTLKDKTAPMLEERVEKGDEEGPTKGTVLPSTLNDERNPNDNPKQEENSNVLSGPDKKVSCPDKKVSWTKPSYAEIVKRSHSIELKRNESNSK